MQLRAAGSPPTTASSGWAAIGEEEKRWPGCGRPMCSASPSLSGESFGVVLLEGMAAGTPVVASDLPAYRVVAEDGRSALLAPTGDADALAKALMQSLEGGHRVLDRVERGRRRAEQFSMATLADAYIARYQRLLG